MGIVKGLNPVEKSLAKGFVEMVLKKAVPSLMENAEDIFKDNKCMVMSIQRDKHGKFVPMIIIYTADSVYEKDSPLMKRENIVQIVPVDDVEDLGNLIAKFI